MRLEPGGVSASGNRIPGSALNTATAMPMAASSVYDTILGENATPEERLELTHYYLAGLTEYWSAWRHYAGVPHFVYLTFCYPNAYTCDNFKDVHTLELHPQFVKYVREAFKPLGSYINFWRPSLKTAALEIAGRATGPAAEPTISRRKVRAHTATSPASDPFRTKSGDVHVEFE